MPRVTVKGPSGPPVTYRFDDRLLTIGRSASNDLVLRDSALSRVHAEIRPIGRAWEVADRGSRNGTRLNGHPVDQPRRLAAGDEVAVGETVIVFDADVAGAVTAADTERPTTPLGWSSRGAGAEPAGTVLIGESELMQRVHRDVEKLAPLDSTVLITGETGTGKELVARLLHELSPRCDAPFVVINCPGLSPSLVEAELFGVAKGVATGVEARVGRLELAHGGTVFLDEVGDLDAAAQSKLLRFLQDKTVERVGGRRPVTLDVRIVAATHRDLEAAIADGSFRSDLYHRLDVMAIELPPLRERLDDLVALVEHFLGCGRGVDAAVTAEALALLRRHHFPGNVRELEHALERARVEAEGGPIRPEDLPERVRRASTATGQGGIEDLYRRVVEDGDSFWEVVRDPYLRRELSREDVRRMIERAHGGTDGGYKGVARLFGIENEHKRLLDFLNRHDLGVKRRE